MTNEDLLKRETLKDIPLFSEFTVEQLRQVTRIGRLEKFVKNKIIFLENENYRGFYIVLKGKIKVFKTSSDGKEHILHIVKPPHPFADVPLFEGGNYPASAQALEDCVLLFVPKNEFLGLLENNAQLSLKMVAGFAKRLKKLSEKLEDITFKEVGNRLAKYIVEEVEKSGTAGLAEPFVKLSLPKSTIASYIGTITETLSRTLKKMQNEKIIRVQGKKIFVEDYPRLKDLAG